MANNQFDFPADSPVTDDTGVLNVVWGQFFTRVKNILNANVEYGPTSDRPTVGLNIGRRYYDTTLNKPVYLSQAKPTVWRDSAGVIV